MLVIDNRDRTFSLDPEDWFNLCDDHGNLVSHRTRKLATDFAAAPEEWCPDCQQKLDDALKPTDAELQAAFLAAREYGKVLDDEVLTAILIAARKAGR